MYLYVCVTSHESCSSGGHKRLEILFDLERFPPLSCACHFPSYFGKTVPWDRPLLVSQSNRYNRAKIDCLRVTQSLFSAAQERQKLRAQVLMRNRIVQAGHRMISESIRKPFLILSHKWDQVLSSHLCALASAPALSICFCKTWTWICTSSLDSWHIPDSPVLMLCSCLGAQRRSVRTTTSSEPISTASKIRRPAAHLVRLHDFLRPPQIALRARELCCCPLGL